MDNSLKTRTCEEFEVFESSIDTQYFGISSAKVILKQPCAEEEKQDALIDFLHEFEFVMISNKASDPINNRWIGEKTSAFLVDTNIQLRKELSANRIIKGGSTNSHLTTITDQLPENDQIVRIAETNFKYSQFLNDPYLPKDKASCIYGDIVKNAFGQPGRFFVVTTIANLVAGFLLFSINSPAAISTIQLIAVNQDFNRQGVGQTMIRSMENYAFSQNIRTVVVGTQVNNFKGLNFYNAIGFASFEYSSIYHYWPLHR